MSIPVDLTELARALDAFDYAYLTTTDAEGRPHVVAVTPAVEQGHLAIGEVGRRTLANASARPQVALVWPPRERSDHSLIVDATCTPQGPAGLRAVPTRAVLHRPAPPRQAARDDGGTHGGTHGGTGCGADCVEVLARSDG